MANGWTDARRTRQASIIHRWAPWLRSTGPKSEAGKRAVSANARKHGLRSRAFREEAKRARKLIAQLGRLAADLKAAP